MIRVELPAHLRTLAHVRGEVTLDIAGQATVRSVLDALEAQYPMLRGTIRDHVTGQRRPFVRFFACQDDLSHEPPDAPLPDSVATGAEPLARCGRYRRRLTSPVSLSRGYRGSAVRRTTDVRTATASASSSTV